MLGLKETEDHFRPAPPCRSEACNFAHFHGGRVTALPMSALCLHWVPGSAQTPLAAHPAHPFPLLFCRLPFDIEPPPFCNPRPSDPGIWGELSYVLESLTQVTQAQGVGTNDLLAVGSAQPLAAPATPGPGRGGRGTCEAANSHTGTGAPGMRRMPWQEIQRKKEPRAGQVMPKACTAEFSRFLNSIADPHSTCFLSADPTWHWIWQ